MTYPTYDKYKESGVPWLGQVPEGWDVVKLRFLASIDTGAKDTENNTDDGEYPFFVRSNTVEKIDSYSYDGEAVLTAGDGVGVGKVFHYYNGKFDFHQRVYAFTKFRRITGKYFYLCFSTFFKYQMYVNAAKSTVDSVRLPFLQNFTFPLPNPTDQKAIAAFLDQKTAEIDALITKKEELLKLLAEQRTALITHAVTKGLNPSVSMKDSGIDWLGHIPAHWEAIRLRFLLSEPLKYGANESAEFEDRSDPRYIRITDVKEDGSLKEETFKSLPEEVAQPYMLDDGDILLARSGATVGKTFIYRPSWGRAAYAGYLIRARISKKANADFIYRFLNSKAYWDWLNSIFIQATIQNVSAEKYANLWVPFPPLEEQQQILDYVNGKLQHMDAVVDKTQQAIDRLKEYRTALITNAVTGKIDVRGYQSKNKEKAA